MHCLSTLLNFLIHTLDLSKQISFFVTPKLHLLFLLTSLPFSLTTVIDLQLGGADVANKTTLGGTTNPFFNVNLRRRFINKLKVSFLLLRFYIALHCSSLSYFFTVIVFLNSYITQTHTILQMLPVTGSLLYKPQRLATDAPAETSAAVPATFSDNTGSVEVLFCITFYNST